MKEESWSDKQRLITTLLSNLSSSGLVWWLGYRCNSGTSPCSGSGQSVSVTTSGAQAPTPSSVTIWGDIFSCIIWFWVSIVNTKWEAFYTRNFYVFFNVYIFWCPWKRFCFPPLKIRKLFQKYGMLFSKCQCVAKLIEYSRDPYSNRAPWIFEVSSCNTRFHGNVCFLL